MKVSHFITFSALLAIAATKPLDMASDEVKILSRGEVHKLTVEVYERFKIYSQYSGSSYCAINTNSGGKIASDVLMPVQCPNDLCPLVQKDNAVKFFELPPIKKAFAPDLRGYVAIDPARKEIIVVFRGTSSSSNKIADLHLTKVALPAFPQCEKCRVHLGFAMSFKERLQDTLTAVGEAQKRFPEYKVIFTGHSLGGAVATIMGVWFREHTFPAAEIWSFGSPRIGNDEWARFATNQDGITYRMTHINDVVPRLPPSFWPFNFKHEGPEFWLGPKGGPTTDNYNISDITICNGVESKACNGGTKVFPINLKTHSHYLGDIDSCDSNSATRDDDQVERLFVDPHHLETIMLAEQGFASGELTELEAFLMVNATMKLSDLTITTIAEGIDFESEKDRTFAKSLKFADGVPVVSESATVNAKVLESPEDISFLPS